MGSQIVKHDPFSMMSELNEVFDSIFDSDAFRPGRHAFPMSAAAMRSHDVTVEGDHLRVSVDVPGVKQDALHVAVQGNEVTVSAKRGQRVQTYRYVIDQDYDVSSAVAQLSDGVLSLTFTRRPETKAKQIEVKVV